jgi:hypothetical protein
MWYTAQMKPRLFNAFLLAGLPPAGQDLSARWKQIAADSLAMLSDSEVRCGAILGSAGCACKAL